MKAIRQIVVLPLFIVVILVSMSAYSDSQSEAPLMALNVQSALGQTSLVSILSNEVESNAHSANLSISGDGRFVIFRSDADNLAPHDEYDSNGHTNIFMHDRKLGLSRAICRTYDSRPLSNDCLTGDISEDGSSIVFVSNENNLVPDDRNDSDVFVYDVATQQIERVSVSSQGIEGNDSSGGGSLSGDGRYVVYHSSADNLVAGDTNGHGDIFWHDRDSGETKRISIAYDGNESNGASSNARISADGKYVVFASYATNLVPNDTNDNQDVFLHELQTGETTRVSIGTDGSQGDAASRGASISADGRFIAFQSQAENLVPQVYASENIFVHDRVVRETTLVSAASDGTPGTYHSREASISGDGRYVAFESYADNLVQGDIYPPDLDVFVHDRVTRETNIISLAPTGQKGNGNSGSPTISGNGKYVSYDSIADNLVASDDNRVSDVFVWDIPALMTSRASIIPGGIQADAPSYESRISSDGRYVAFASEATALWLGETDGLTDVFVRDLNDAQTQHASVIEGDDEFLDPDISSNGAFVVFVAPYISQNHSMSASSSDESGIVHIYNRDTQQTSQIVSDASNPRVSADGRFVVFESWLSTLVPGDTNGLPDIFVRDRQTGEITRVSVSSDGRQADSGSIRPSISESGRYVAFMSLAGNLVAGDTNSLHDVFVHDRELRTTVRVSVASDGSQARDGESRDPSVSTDGRYVAFTSESEDLVWDDSNNDADIFVHDLETGITARVSVSSSGSQSNYNSSEPDISGNGRYVTFRSLATNLVSGDTNGAADIFVHDRETGQTRRVSIASDGAQSNGDSSKPAISSDGRRIAFESNASNLVQDDSNSVRDVFVHTLPDNAFATPTSTSTAMPQPTETSTPVHTLTPTQTPPATGDWSEVGLGSASGAGVSSNAGQSAWPALAASPDGRIFLVWHDNTSGNDEVYVLRWNQSSWQPVGVSSASGGGISNNTGSSRAAAIAVSADGIPYVAWRDNTSGYGEIYVRRWNGSSWEEVGSGSASGGGISNQQSTSTWWPSIAIGPDGSPHVAWDNWDGSDQEIYMRRWDGTQWIEVGTGSGSGGGVSNDAGNSWWPTIAFDPSGKLYLSWQDESGPDSEVYVRSWTGSDWAEVGSGSASGGGISDNLGASLRPVLAVAPDGMAYVAWFDDSGGNLEIYARRWNGTTWSEIGSGSAIGGGISNNAGASRQARLAVSASGRLQIAWYDDTSGTPQIYLRSWNGSTWHEEGASSATGGGISNTSGVSGLTSVAVGPDSTAYVAWGDNTNGNYEIYVRNKRISDEPIPTPTPTATHVPGATATATPSVTPTSTPGGFSRISGRIADEDGSPMAGVIISYFDEFSTNTEPDGYYYLNNLTAGTYTLVPFKAGFVFEPPLRTITVPPDAAGQDFAGHALDETAFLPFVIGR